MWINFGCKAVWAFFVIALFHFGFSGVVITPFVPMAVAAVSVAVVGTWLDHLLLPQRSDMTAALIDCFAFALLLYGLQFLFSGYSLNNQAALAIGLVLASLEWMIHRQIHRQPRHQPSR
ncbi:DUF2512 family protein [Desmospora profundinema]|uniref:DUF2512 family protein n=1 Tax=Desmospora profundinema TaxID=1571184 RepID=A0ABU1ILG2_9BACL|nr:DUF2512 family protein [Desmospora profundinema]MDR6225531.1 hypothetical protein [Desmospora profundinema]